MTKRQKNSYSDRMTLKKAGWNLSSSTDYLAFNGGSESIDHWIGKACAAYALREVGYRVASEVTKESDRDDVGGEIDLVGYGHDSRAIIAIEIETDLTRDVILDKVERYCVDEPMSDLFAFDPDDLPGQPGLAIGQIEGEISL